MVEECDLLLFDEPTNDLDIATLENLEESFESFPGAIVLITHDRYLLERTASSVLGLRDGHALIYGSYSQWESAQKDTPQPSRSKKEPSQVETKKAPPTKLSYKDARELATIEEQIAKAEERVASIQSELASEHNATNSSKLSDLCESLRIEQLEVERLYERWQQLETMQKALIK
jgi:ATP-binding cassette subfamily F protein uup